MNRFHLEGHGVAPHLPLTATETQANTQDPGALRLPRLPFHPIALRLTRATNAHPLHPAALAFVSYGIVLVQVHVQGWGVARGRGCGREGVWVELLTYC